MPRTVAHSPLRRLVLQVVLCLVLVATLGLASLVTRYKLRASDVKLTSPVKFEDFTARVPANWTFGPPTRTPAGPLVIKLNEHPPQDIPPRTLTIIRDHRDIPEPPAEYLLTSGQMSPNYAVKPGGGDQLSPPSSIIVAGHPGYLVTGLHLFHLNTGEMLTTKDVFATAMLPSRDVITVHLEGVGPVTPADLDLVRDVAAGVTLPSPPLGASTAITLANGATVKVPAGFSPLPEPESQITERHMIRSVPPARWSSITLVPCVFFPDSDNEETFRTMLTARDAEWLQAKITRTAPLFRADAPLRNGLPYPRRAVLLASATGHALLVELRAGSPQDAAEWDALLKQIVDSATPPTAAAPVDLLKAGEAEVARLAKIGLPTLLKDVPADQFWVWTTRDRPLAWNHSAFTPADPSQGLVETKIAAAGGSSVAIREAFETSADFSRHVDDSTRLELLPKRPPSQKFHEQTSVAAGKYTIVLTLDAAAGQLARSTGTLPKAFIPGQWIPLLAGKFSDREIILRTTSLPGLEAQAATSFMNVRIRPTTRPATFDLDLSGTGQILTISPDTIVFSSTMLRRRTTPDELKKIIAADPSLAP